MTNAAAFILISTYESCTHHRISTNIPFCSNADHCDYFLHVSFTNIYCTESWYHLSLIMPKQSQKVTIVQTSDVD